MMTYAAGPRRNDRVANQAFLMLEKPSSETKIQEIQNATKGLPQGTLVASTQSKQSAACQQVSKRSFSFLEQAGISLGLSHPSSYGCVWLKAWLGFLDIFQKRRVGETELDLVEQSHTH